MLEFTNSRAAH